MRRCGRCGRIWREEKEHSRIGEVAGGAADQFVFSADAVGRGGAGADGGEEEEGRSGEERSREERSSEEWSEWRRNKAEAEEAVDGGRQAASRSEGGVGL